MFRVGYHPRLDTELPLPLCCEGVDGRGLVVLPLPRHPVLPHPLAHQRAHQLPDDEGCREDEAEVEQYGPPGGLLDVRL